MSKSLADNPFITEMKDKNGDSWYHQIVLELKDKEIERLNNIINKLEKWLKEEYEGTIFDYHNAIEDVLNKLQELKGSDKVE